MKEDKASSTAYTVLHGILHTIKNPKLAHLVDKETVQACTKILSSTSEGRRRPEELKSPIKSKILPFLEWLLLPGITLNYVLRKKFIKEIINNEFYRKNIFPLILMEPSNKRSML